MAFREQSEKIRPYLFLIPLVLSFFVLFFRLSARAFIDYDEAAFSEVVRETLKAHQFLSLQFIGAPWFHKPPLYFWLAMGATKVFPSVEFAMRSVSAFFGVAVVMLVYAVAKCETGNDYAALASSLILLGIGGFVDLGRQVKMDLPVIFSIVLSYYSYLRATNAAQDKRGKWFVLFGVAIAAGILFKSVIGLLAFPLIFIHSFFSKKWSWLKDRFFWLGLVLAGALAAPWHIYESFVYGKAFWDNYLFGQVVDRLTSNLFASHLSLMQISGLYILNTFPWLIVFIVSLFFLRKSMQKELRVPLLTYAVYVVFIFLAFTLSKTRVDYYVAPAYPFIALYLSYFAFVFWKEMKTRKARNAFASIFVALCVVSVASMIAVGYDLLPQLSYEQHLAEDEKQIGLILRGIPEAQPIFFQSPTYWETIRFYSQGKQLEQYQAGKESYGSLVVVMNNQLAQNSDFTTLQYQILFKGNLVSLIKM